MENITLTLTMEQIELLLNTIEYCEVEYMFERGTEESVLEKTHDDLVTIQKYLLRKLG